MKNFLPLIVALLLSACTTIEIKEEDAFDNHQTVTPESFSSDVLQLTQDFVTTDDGFEINTWQLLRDDAQATVLYFGGNGFLMVKSKPWIDAYATMPVNLILFDYRGYGQSPGEPSVEGILSDSRNMYNVAREVAETYQTPLYIHGHSMGSFLSSYIAQREEVAGYILESPISEVSGWTNNLVPWLLRPFISFDIDPAIASQNNLERVKSIELPLLIMGGSDDNVTPFEMAEELYEASASSSKEIIKIEGGNHNDLPYFDRYVAEIKSFIFE